MNGNARRTIIAIVVAATGATVAPPGHAQEEIPPEPGRTGSTGGEFLAIPVGARGVAMGRAFTAAVDDVSALWWNPAGLGFMRGPAAFFTNVDLPLDVQLNYVGVGVPVFEGGGVVGAAFEVLSTGEIPVTTVSQPEGTGETFESWSANAQVTYAHNVTGWLATGGSVKWVYENIAGIGAEAFQFDLGSVYHTDLGGRGVRVAFVIQNLGTRFRSETSSAEPSPILPPSDAPPAETIEEPLEFKPPTTLKTALAYYVIEGESATFLVNGEFAAPLDLEAMYSIGGEWTHVLVPAVGDGHATTVAARVGYTHQQDAEDLLGRTCCVPEGQRGLGFGGGLQMDFSDFAAGFDYAFRDWGRLGGTNNFSVTVLF